MFSLLLVFIYLSFISLGLPDSLLGAAWPIMHQEFGVNISYSGIVFMIISFMTVISSLQSDRLTKKLGTAKVTAISVATTAIAMIGFALSNNFILLCVWAIPYGLGAGSVDAALNNYVALNYSSKHMSWLHCMWGVGASIGPYIMSGSIRSLGSWNYGYGIIGIMQVVLAFALFMSLPLWKSKTGEGNEEGNSEVIPLKKIFALRGAKAIFITFFCYSAVEMTTALWASSYLVINRGIDAKTAAAYAALFYLGITGGRALNGFLTVKFNDTQLIRMGCFIIGIGAVMVFLPFSDLLSLIGLIVIGLGCAPIYPCIIHSTPIHFGKENSQAMVGVQMACAYTGTTLMPPLFGLIAEHVSIALFPVYLAIFLILMATMHEIVVYKCEKQKP